MKSSFDTVLGMAQMLIQNSVGSGSSVTRNEISDTVDRVMAINPAWPSSVDHQQVIRELETRFTIWIGQPSILAGEDVHVAWLNASRKKGWRYWPRYRQHLEISWSPVATQALDETSDTILELLEDPVRDGPWDRRGLVVGHVQSGKTANYTGLLCKAADAGYKVLIVLAGTHNSLRSQTQMRLDEGFLGYESAQTPSRGVLQQEFHPVGVGLIDSDPSISPYCFTNRSTVGDISRRVAGQLGFTPGERPVLFVVKKNASVLKNLLTWIRRAADEKDPETGRPILRNVPLLMIDDEADHASVDTGLQEYDEDGKPDQDYDPKVINGLIRRILHSFNKSALVGYTATPFANIFIHDKGRTLEEGEDLFPRSFILNLPAPSNYSGPARIFGLEPNVETGNGSSPLSLVRHVTDHAISDSAAERIGWAPPGHKNGHRPLYDGRDEIPPSLREAIMAFILACAGRRARGQTGVHHSMLVHVTRFTSVQKAVKRQVEKEVQVIERRLRHGETGTSSFREGFKKMWEEDFLPTTSSVILETGDNHLPVLSWEVVEPHLLDVLDDVRVREINGTAGDVLDYENHRQTGLAVIAIGGDKLSRGLTLEGLSVSYFLRSSRMYDTLMQMGRWFGYRPGYLDLCRLFTTRELDEWFQHITEANEELRQEFDHMVAIGGTPRQYGLKVKSHPALMVTSRVKMRHHATLRLSFAGSLSETVVFHRQPEVLTANLAATERLLTSLGPAAETDPARTRPGGRQERWKQTTLWNGVSPDRVIGFLGDYRTHEAAVKVNGELLARYIEAQNRVGELTDWTVVLVSGGDGGKTTLAGFPVDLLERSPNERCHDMASQKRLGRYMIRRLLAPRDEAIDLDQNTYESALARTVAAWHADPGRSRRREAPDMPLGPFIREMRPPQRGLLLLYPLAPAKGGLSIPGPLIGVGISFPASSSASQVEYVVNNIYSEMEMGATE